MRQTAARHVCVLLWRIIESQYLRNIVESFAIIIEQGQYHQQSFLIGL